MVVSRHDNLRVPGVMVRTSNPGSANNIHNDKIGLLTGAMDEVFNIVIYGSLLINYLNHYGELEPQPPSRLHYVQSDGCSFPTVN